MNIVVPVKSVVDVELNIRVRDGKIVEDGLNYILSKWDENALEAALQLKEANGGEVTALTIGPERSGEALRKALAMGADKGVHVNDPACEGSDSFGYASILAKVIQRGPYDLVITGRQAQDTDMGATGAALAELLGVPLCVNIVRIEPKAEGGKLTLRRKGDAGAEVMEVTLPALLTANDSLNEPRLASLRGIMQAKKKPIATPGPGELGLAAGEIGAAGSRLEIVSVSFPESGTGAEIIEGDPAAAARTLVEKLRKEARVI